MKAMLCSPRISAKAGVFGQEAIAWMDGVCAGDLAGRQQRGNVEIGIARGRRPDAHAFIGELDVHRLGIGGGMPGDGGDSHFHGRAQDAQRDLAPVGDEDFIEHP